MIDHFITINQISANVRQKILFQRNPDAAFYLPLIGYVFRQGNIEGWAKNQDKFDVGKSIVKIKQLIISPIK